MGAPFGFTGFLGVASFIGVIASHLIVLFGFIEEKHVEGEALEQALLDAGIMRLRPVLITVGAGGGFPASGPSVPSMLSLARASGTMAD
jgi:multidrug efflux pump